jgi:hypothetical protein
MPNHPNPAPPPSGQSAAHPARPADAPTEVTLRVQVAPEIVARMRFFASREGATVEALAALWLEEKLAEAERNTPGRRPAPGHAAAAEE